MFGDARRGKGSGCEAFGSDVRAVAVVGPLEVMLGYFQVCISMGREMKGEGECSRRLRGQTVADGEDVKGEVCDREGGDGTG